MTLPKELTTVTLVSRIVELIVLVAAMIISFGLGVNYQETIDLLKQQNSSIQATMIKPTTLISDETANWKTYINNDWGITFNYPVLWDIKTYGNDPKMPTYVELVSNLLPMIGFTYIDTPKLAPNNYITVILKNGNTAYYEKEYLCEPSICERYIIQHPHKIITVTIFPRDKQSVEFRENIDQILSTFKFTD